MDTRTLRSQLEAKKAEIERALEELDRIESLVGCSTGRSSSSSPSRVSAWVSSSESPSHLSHTEGRGIAQSVLEAIQEKEGTIREIAYRLDLTVMQVRNAIKTDRLNKLISRRKRHGMTVYYCKHKEEPSNGLPGLSDGVLQFLKSRPGEAFTAKAVTDELEGKVSSQASNLLGSVSSTLTNLRKAGKIAKATDGGFLFPEPLD